jgi:hypothetical protein
MPMGARQLRRLNVGTGAGCGQSQGEAGCFDGGNHFHFIGNDLPYLGIFLAHGLGPGLAPYCSVHIR